MKLSLLTFSILFSSFISFSQETNNNNNTLENQFDRIYRTSSSYKTYKVISKERFQKLKFNVLDSLNASKKIISEKESLLKSEKEKTQNITTSLVKTQQELEIATNKENTISFFGAQISKGTYSLILWFIIVALILGLLYFMYKFSKSNVLTKKAQSNLLDTEQEFEKHRKKALEREQKLRRQLQDEINKQRNV